MSGPLSSSSASARRFLGIEGGATRTVAAWGDAAGRVHSLREAGPLNLKLTSDAQILRVLRPMARPALDGVAVCLAGLRTERDRIRLRTLIRKIWGPVPCTVGSDLDSGFVAAFGVDGSGILVISGTGSCVYGRQAGRSARVGGWGHLLGDHGSGYWIALEGLRRACHQLDRTRKPGPVLRIILRRLGRQSPDTLVDWVQQASKAQVASMAGVVLNCDRTVAREASERFALDCAVLSRRLRLRRPSIALAGGVFRHNPRFRSQTARRIRQCLPGAVIQSVRHDSVRGALLLACRAALEQPSRRDPWRD